MYIKKLFLLPLILLLCLFVQPVSAHFEMSDSKINAVLHMDPDDDPIAGQPTTFYVQIQDSQNKYQPSKCTCTFSIIEGGKVLYTQSLFKLSANPGLNTPVAVYTLPQRDVYEVAVDGAPTTLQAFQSFKLVWDIRVDRQSTTNQAQSMNMNDQQSTNSTNLPLVLIGGIFLVAIAIVVYFSFFKKKPAHSNQSSQPSMPPPVQPTSQHQPLQPETPQSGNTPPKA